MACQLNEMPGIQTCRLLSDWSRIVPRVSRPAVSASRLNRVRWRSIVSNRRPGVTSRLPMLMVSRRKKLHASAFAHFVGLCARQAGDRQCHGAVGHGEAVILLETDLRRPCDKRTENSSA